MILHADRELNVDRVSLGEATSSRGVAGTGRGGGKRTGGVRLLTLNTRLQLAQLLVRPCEGRMQLVQRRQDRLGRKEKDASAVRAAGGTTLRAAESRGVDEPGGWRSCRDFSSEHASKL